jgi:hypothetical protein
MDGVFGKDRVHTPLMSAPHATPHTGKTPAGISPRTCALVPTHGSPGVPHSVWLPPHGAVRAPAVAGSALPVWALERACAQFAPSGGPAAVLRPPGPGHTERTARATDAAPAWLATALAVDLADTGRARLDLALMLADPAPGPLAATELLPGFFAEIRAALRPGAVLLIHTHPAHTKDGMHEPAGELLHAARTAGFAYLQHLVLVHHPLSAIAPHRARLTAPRSPVHRRVHSDLYALTDANGARR